MSRTAKYVAVADGFILGRFFAAGEEVELTDAQAEWELRAGRVKPKEEPQPQPQSKAKKAKAER